MILKYTATLIITWVAYNVISAALFNFNDLLIICGCCFIYAFNIVNINRHHPLAISTIALALMMIFDGSCVYRYGDVVSIGRYYYCVDYDATRILAAYSWALGGLIAIMVVGLIRLGRRNQTTTNSNVDHVVNRITDSSNSLPPLLSVVVNTGDNNNKQFKLD
ncbi:hypothetical protein F-VV57_0054 [Faustovirus]|nr:hypothetical protein F-VV57_0054 [Faustovirus]QJX73322.1 poxvirus early transcription factor (VETF) large subunit [Faustovirus]